MPSSLFGPTQTPVANPVPAIAGRNPLDPYRQMYQMVQSSKNPQAMLMNMLMQNPNMNENAKEVFNAIRQNGGNIQQTFLSVAKHKGLDPTQVISSLQQGIT